MLIPYTYHESYLIKTKPPTTLNYVFHNQPAELYCMCSSCLNAKLNAKLLFSDFQELGWAVGVSIKNHRKGKEYVNKTTDL